MHLFSWHTLDSLLRGKFSDIASPQQARSLFAWQLVLAAFFGMCLGLFALSARDVPDARFTLGAALKLPVLIIGATFITLPSLYVFLALFDVPLRFGQVLGGMLAANTVFATVIASLGPILGFFSLSSQSYPFILLLTVAICGLGGLLGMRLVVKTLSAISLSTTAEDPQPLPPSAGAEDADASPPPLFPHPFSTKSTSKSFIGWRGILSLWMVLYVFVGTQLAWILRPFIGNPESPFVWFRGTSGSFVDTVLKALGDYLGG